MAKHLSKRIGQRRTVLIHFRLSVASGNLKIFKYAHTAAVQEFHSVHIAKAISNMTFGNTNKPYKTRSDS